MSVLASSWQFIKERRGGKKKSRTFWGSFANFTMHSIGCAAIVPRPSIFNITPDTHHINGIQSCTFEQMSQFLGRYNAQKSILEPLSAGTTKTARITIRALLVLSGFLQTLIAPSSISQREKKSASKIHNEFSQPFSQFKGCHNTVHMPANLVPSPACRPK